MDIREMVKKINLLTSKLKNKKEYTKKDLAELYDAQNGVFSAQAVEELGLGEIWGDHRHHDAPGRYDSCAHVAWHIVNASNLGLLYNRNLPEELRGPLQLYLRQVSSIMDER